MNNLPAKKQPAGLQAQEFNATKYGLAFAPLWLRFHADPRVQETHFVLLHSLFKDVDQSHLSRAVLEHMKRSKYMPEVSDLNQLLKEISLAAGGALAHMIEGLDKLGYDYEEEGQHPAGHRAWIFRHRLSENKAYICH